MASSFQNEIPAARINLKLDVSKGTTGKKTELPLKLLVLGDFSCDNNDERVVEREKVSIDKNNFEKVMESLDLKIGCCVDNKLADNGEIDVNLTIKNLDSFKPENVAKSIPELSRLLAARNLIKDLKSNLLDNRNFRLRLEEIVKNPGAIKALQEELTKMIPGGESSK